MQREKPKVALQPCDYSVVNEVSTPIVIMPLGTFKTRDNLPLTDLQTANHKTVMQNSQQVTQLKLSCLILRLIQTFE